MNKDYKILKDKYGEKFARLCRELFPSLLEKEGFLSDLILSHFASSHYLYDDIVETFEIDNFRDYIYELAHINDVELLEVDKSVRELLSDAGYDFYECKCEEDIQKFKRYYANGEELCTFKGNRLNNCYVFFAVSKNVDNIIREDFINPSRQDEYGTSVISIQFSREDVNYLSIKNRYNHIVNNPDATFSNNLENIIPGLTRAFEKEYNLDVKQNDGGDFELDNYVMAKDGKWYRYNYEFNNISYCFDNIIIDNGEVNYLDKNRYLLIDYFIIDIKDKKISFYDDSIVDSFADIFENIDKIEVKLLKNHNKEITIIINDKDIVIEIDKFGRMIAYKDNNTIVAPDNFLKKSQYLEIFECSKLTEMGNYTLEHAVSLNEFNCPLLTFMGNYCLYRNDLEEFHCSKLTEMGDYCFARSLQLQVFDCLELIKMGNHSLRYVPRLIKFACPNLKEMGIYCLKDIWILQEFCCYNLKEIGDFCLSDAYYLKSVQCLNLEKIGSGCFDTIESLEKFYCPNLKKIGKDSLFFVKSLFEFICPNLIDAPKYIYDRYVNDEKKGKLIRQRTL